MRFKKEAVLLTLAISLVLFLNFNFVSAGILCADNQIILKLSSSTNAHAEAWNGSGNYPVEICYDRIFGVNGSGSRICSGTNKVVGLSSSTNAHAESPSQNNYPIDICYGDISCRASTNGCLAGENLTLSLSSSTNAHLSNSSSYGTSICCTPPSQAQCTLNSASWSVTQTGAGQNVNLNVATSNCDGLSMTFNVMESDPVGGDDPVVTNPNPIIISSGQGVGNWTAEWQDDGSGDPEYYFIASVTGAGTIQSSNQLTVAQNSSCIINSASWASTQKVDGENVALQVLTSNCIGETLSFEVLERDAAGGDDPVLIEPVNVVVSGDVSTGNWIAEWQEDISGNPEYYFIVTVVSLGSQLESSNELSVSQDLTECETTVTCSDYSEQTSCGNDACGVSVDSVSAVVDCGSGANCFCSWNSTASQCNGAWSESDQNPEGTCYYEEESIDTCEDDGFLTINLVATWILGDGSVGTNPECQSTTEIIQCPVQIPLSFFTSYNIILTIVLIIIIYLIINRKKGRRNKR